MDFETVAAISTPIGSGGIGVIRISGSNAIEIAERAFKPVKNKRLCDLDGYTATYGTVYNGEEEIDKAVALVFRAPNSYTGEDVVEISCHGGIFITNHVLRAVISAGALPAPAGEFTKRAFLNGKIDLTQAEAVMDLINANSKSSARAALYCEEGALNKRIEQIRHELVQSASHLAAWADYPEEDIPELTYEQLTMSLNDAYIKLEKLIDEYDSGRVIREGVDTLIVGKPNVGKSTLMNLFSGKESSIVTDIPGTTRDIVEETVTAGKVVLRLSDTAGLRETDDPIEKIGVSKAKERIKSCGLVLGMFDASSELTDEDKQLLEICKDGPFIAVINKTDLENKIDEEYIEKRSSAVVMISAKNESGIDNLVNEIEKITLSGDLDLSQGILVNERQRQSAVNAFGYVKEAVEALKVGITLDAVTVSIELAIEELLILVGKKASEEILHQVFSRFCVGK